MKDTKYTKGDWTAKRGSPNTVYISAKDKTSEIARVYRDIREKKGISEEEMLANAKLMAASPEILDLLDSAVALLKKIDGRIHYSLAVPYETIIERGEKIIQEFRK